MEDNPTLDLAAFQSEVLAWHLRHFECFPEHALQKAAAELGELQSLDLDRQLNQDPGVTAIALELADVVIALTAYAARLGISVEGALIAKWATIKARPAERVARPSAGGR